MSQSIAELWSVPGGDFVGWKLVSWVLEGEQRERMRPMGAEINPKRKDRRRRLGGTCFQNCVGLGVDFFVYRHPHSWATLWADNRTCGVFFYGLWVAGF